MTALLFLTLVLSQVSTDLQRIVDDAVVLDQYGYASQSTVIHFPKGHYYLDEPLVYRGQPHTQLVLRGVGRAATVLHYRGSENYAIRFEGANHSSIESMRIINEATKPIDQVIWFDAVNADKNASKFSSGSSACMLIDVWIGSEKKSLAKDGCLFRIGHAAPETSQVSEVVAQRVRFHGPGHGTGALIPVGSNVKNFTFSTIAMSYLYRGIDLQHASGLISIDDLSCGEIEDAVVRQIGSGNLIGHGWNCEGTGPMLWQAGGSGPMFASITGFEWTSDKETMPVRCHGATKLEAGFFQGWGKTPWLEMTYPLRAAKAPCSLELDRVWFSGGDDDRLPIRDGSGNKVLDPAGWYKDRPVSFSAESCFIAGKKVERVK